MYYFKWQDLLKGKGSYEKQSNSGRLAATIYTLPAQLFNQSIKCIAVYYKIICQGPPMKKTLKIQRHAQPIPLAPRKNSARQPSEVSPRQKDWESVVLRSIDSNRSPNDMILTMKRDNNKENVEKIRGDQVPSENKVVSRLELQSLKEEVAFRRHTEEQLRRDIIELKAKVEQNGDAAKDRYKNDREKQIIGERINKLQQELTEMNQVHQLKEQAKNQRIQLLSKELQKLQGQKHRLATECSRLDHILRESTKPKTDQETQHVEDEVMELRRKMHDIEKQRFNISAKLKQKDLELRKTIEECQVTVKERDGKYNNCLNQFKKLQSKLGRSKDESIGALRAKVQQLENALQSQHLANQNLRSQNTQLISKLERAKHQTEEQRRYNQQLTTKFRTHQTESSHSQRTELINLSQQICDLRAEVETHRQKYEQKCRETVVSEKPRSLSTHNDELHRARLEILSLEIIINKMKGDVERHREELQAALEISSQKDLYIEELEKQKDLGGDDPVVEQMERRCKEICEEQRSIAEEYEDRVIKLEKELAYQRSKEKDESITPRSFDEALKYQIVCNEQLRESERAKSEEIINLRNQIQQWRRKADSLKSQSEIDRLKGMTQQKTIKCHFEITIQNLKSELQSQQRKYETLQRKANYRTDQLQKKDLFIQQIIIGKCSKLDTENEIEYLRKQLAKFFSVNYESQLLTAQDRIEQLETLVEYS